MSEGEGEGGGGRERERERERVKMWVGGGCSVSIHHALLTATERVVFPRILSVLCEREHTKKRKGDGKHE